MGATSSKVTQQEAAHIGLLEGWGPACIYHRLGFLREPAVEWVGGGDHVLCTYRLYPHVVIDIARPEKTQGHRESELGGGSLKLSS